MYAVHSLQRVSNSRIRSIFLSAPESSTKFPGKGSIDTCWIKLNSQPERSTKHNITVRNGGQDRECPGGPEARLWAPNSGGPGYADDTILTAESEEELKSLLMKVKEESEKAALKLSIQKTKIMASGPITSWQIKRGKIGSSDRFYFPGLQNQSGY